ncbi:class I SAM-dependent methyltransferase [Demequina sp.]|uniref:class I SAM-dependent methyltransferase n=1 Tax=Demequina sp. TaxID=2050685 RepID=UPI0025F91947|nr:class I SAM-dependent methyltransferase [Demequina sp.]
MDTWDAGELYEQYMGRWSRSISASFLGWLDADKDARWLDVGCGTGALTAQIVTTCRPSRVVGIDTSEAFIAAARRHLSTATFDVGDAAQLPYENRSFDVTVSAIALNFVPAPSAAIGHMVRVTEHGGLVAAYVWDYAEGMEMLREFWDAAIALDPAASELDEARRFPLCAEGALATAFAEAGLTEVEQQPLKTATAFESFEDLWEPFLSGQGPAPSYVASLDAAHRSALEGRLRGSLPTGPAGEITLSATAWAVKGRVSAHEARSL